APTIAVEALGKEPVELPIAPSDGELVLRLNLDPDDEANQDDRYVLEASGGGLPPQVTTAADAITPDDPFTDLLYVGLDRGLSYTLRVEQGLDASGAQGEPYTVFEDVPFARLAGLVGADPAAVDSQALQAPRWS